MNSLGEQLQNKLAKTRHVAACMGSVVAGFLLFLWVKAGLITDSSHKCLFER